jgi:hypothetical protein
MAEGRENKITPRCNRATACAPNQFHLREHIQITAQSFLSLPAYSFARRGDNPIKSEILTAGLLRQHRIHLAVSIVRFIIEDAPH